MVQGHDGDADRTICIDENGSFVLGDKTFTLVEKQMLKENGGGTIVTTVATSQAIYDVAEEYNGEVIATAVGDLLVARELKERDGLFGGEENGGLIFPDFIYGRDAAMTFINKYFDVVENKDSFLGIDYLYLGLSEIAAAKQSNGTYEKGAYEAGLRNVQKGISLDASLAEEMNAHALSLFNDQNYEQAYFLFDLGTLDKQSPNYVYDSYYKGNCLFLTNENPFLDNQLNRATDAFNEAMKISPTTHEALLMNARAYRYMDTDAAKPKMAENYEKFVDVLAKKNMLKDADMKDALVESYMFIGTYYLKSDKIKSKTAFNKVLELDPNHEYSINALKKLK